MRKILPAVASALVVYGLAAVALFAQQRLSPHEQTSAAIAGKKITIEYGRPYKKDRKIYGGLVPFGEVWRTGADEATTITTDAGLTIGTLQVPKGTYSLFTIPTAKEWTLVINKTARQWGAFSYDQKTDLGRTPMKVETLSPPLEQLTVAIESKGGNQGLLKINWDTTSATVPITVH